MNRFKLFVVFLFVMGNAFSNAYADRSYHIRIENNTSAAMSFKPQQPRCIANPDLTPFSVPSRGAKEFDIKDLDALACFRVNKSFMWAYNDGMGTVTFNHDLVSVSTWHTYVEFSSVGRLIMADTKFSYASGTATCNAIPCVNINNGVGDSNSTPVVITFIDD